MKRLSLLLLTLVFCVKTLNSQVILDADGEGDTYELITSVLAPTGNPIEVPDCSHPGFGRHIDEVYDTTLKIYVFRFHIHVVPDNDRCINFDRQRNEIKAYSESADSLLGVIGETFIYKWKFKIDSNFQSSSSFTHLHQLKAVGGPEEDMPLITLTARKGTPDKLELRYAATTSQITIASAALGPFKGAWVEVTETVKYGEIGEYSISAVRVDDSVSLLQYSSNTRRMWKTNAEFIRPKWGIYRSLNYPSDLRDEIVCFANFSIKEEKPVVVEDTIKPTVVISTTASEPVNAPFEITITFSEVVSGLTEEEILVQNGTVQPGSLSSTDNIVYTATIIPTSSGNIIINLAASSVQDGAGNNNVAAAEIIVIADLVTNINLAITGEIILYPNPSYGFINIIADENSKFFEVSIFEQNGWLIYNERFANGNIHMDLSAYKKGIYIIRIKTPDAVTCKKIILE